MKTLDEIKAAIAEMPQGLNYDADQEGDDLVIATSLSYDGEPWPNHVVLALAGTVGVEPTRFEEDDPGCPCCGYMSSIVAVNYFAAEAAR